MIIIQLQCYLNEHIFVPVAIDIAMDSRIFVLC